MADWQNVRLGDLGEVNRGRSRHRPRDAAHLYGGPYPFIQTGDIKAANGRIIRHSQTYSEAGLAQSRLWPTGTMAITIAANIAETAILTYPACFPDSVVGFIADPRKADVRFIEYLFRLLRRQIQHENVGTGSVQDNINLQTLERLRISIPALAGQQAISAILGALDDKIDLNRRMNETLETMARAIFKDWFVDFGPTRAKMEGRAPYLSPDVWSLFPDKLQDINIPTEWRILPLMDLTDKIGSGATPRGGNSVYISDGVSLIRSQNVYDHHFDWSGLAHITEVDAERLSGVTVKSQDVLINITGDSILRTCVVDDAVLPARVNQHVAIIRARPGISSRFLHQYLVQESSKEKLLGNDAGASRPAVTKGHLESFLIACPPSSMMKLFDMTTKPLFDMVSMNNIEMRTLAATRDLLLPKLMSGEIRIKDAEKMVETVL